MAKYMDSGGLSHFMSLIKRDTATTFSAEGERTIVTENAADLPLLTLSPVYGESVQDGTPTPDAPKELASVKPLNRLTRADWLNGTTLINCSLNNMTCTYHDDKSVPSGYYLRFTVVDDTKGAWAYLANMKSRGGMIHGETYVASAWVRANRNIQGTFNPMMECNSGVAYPDRGAFTTEWKRFSVRFTFNKNANYQAFYFLYLGNADYTSTGDYFDVYGLQLSYGAKLYDYAPNDKIAISSKGKNLLSFPSWNMMSAYPVTGSYYNCPIYLEPNTTYYLSTTYDSTGNPNNGGYLLVSQETNNQHWKGIGHSSAGKSDGTLITGADGVLYLNFYGSQTQYEYFLAHASSQLEKGITATAYEPYRESVTYIDLKGNGLHGLDETYRDILRIDASGHATIEKRTGKADVTGNWSFASNDSGRGCRFVLSGITRPAYAASVTPLFLSNIATPLYWSATHGIGAMGADPSSTTTLQIRVAQNVTSVDLFKSTYPDLEVLYPLPESAWYTIDLGYVDLPQVTDDSTVHVAAEVQPVIGGSWWTKSGEGAGEAHSDVVERCSSQQPFVVGTQEAASYQWTGECPQLDGLHDGQQITYWLPFSVGGSSVGATYTTISSGATTNTNGVVLDLVLADGTHTGEIPVWYAGVSRLTSHYQYGSAIHLTYRENSIHSGTYRVEKGWWADANYDSDTHSSRYTDACIAGLNGLKRYTLCMRDANGNWTSITTTANNAGVSGKAAYTGGLMLGNVLYHASGGDYAAGASAGQLWESRVAFDFRYSVNGVQNAAATELQYRKPVYLVGSIDPDDGLFYLDTTKWWTQDPSDATKAYVLVGWAYTNYYAVFLAVNNPTYILQNGKLVEYHVGKFEGSLSGNATTATSATTASALTYNPTGRPSSMNNNYHDSKLRYYIASGATSTGKPPTDANVLHLAWDNSGWDRQLALGCNSSDNLKPKAYIRTENGSGTWGDWQTVYTTAETVAVANGGTGQTTAQAAANALIGALDNSAAQNTDYTDNTSIITTNVSGTTGTYYHRKASLLWNYIKGKISSVLGLTADNGAYQQAQAAITVQTGSTKQTHITLQTLMAWLITTKQYIPSGKECRVELHISWSYADNDILQFTASGVNYELQLAGCVVVFEGNATAYNAGRFRLTIYSSPADSFTAASGYNKVPLNSIAVYSCNGSTYAPAWNLLVHTGNLTAGTGLSKSGFTLNHSNSVTAGTAGTSSATSGTNTLAVPYVTYDAQGHVTASGTHTHTIGNASTSAYGVTKLESSTGSTSTALAATPSAVNRVRSQVNMLADADNPTLTGWTKESNVTVSWDSSVGMYKVTDSSHTSSRWGIWQEVDVIPNTVYTISANLEAGSKAGNISVGKSGAFPSTNTISSSDAADRKRVTFTTGSDWTKARIYVHMSPTAAGDYFYVLLPVLVLGQGAFDSYSVVPVVNGGTGATTAANARTSLDVPPTSHASTATTYGSGTDANYGHVKLSDATNGTSVAASGGTAATPKAVSDALAAAKTYADGKNNQNAFSNVKVGSTTVAADTTTDTLELAGSNVTLTPDATNDKVTIGITASNVTTALGNTAVARATADASGNTITSTYATKTEVDNIEVGGSNLLRYSGTLNLGDESNANNNAVVDGGYAGATKQIEITSAWSGPHLKLGQALTRAGVSVGETVTLSIWLSTNSTTEVATPALYLCRATTAGSTVGINGSSTTNVAVNLIAGKWVRLWCTFQVTEYSLIASTTRFEFSQATSYKQIWSAPKLERGDRPTDWSPAPEDIPGSLAVKNPTVATNTYADTNPKISFHNADGSQNISLTFSDYDSVQAPASLTLNGNQGGEYFIAPHIKATGGFHGSLDGNASTASSAAKLTTARTINVGNYATGTATGFDGSANITIPVNSLNTNALVEPSIVKSSSKTSLPLVETLKGNKLALLPADQIIIEKTTDGGATWVDYGATDEQKRLLFVGNTSGPIITVPLLNNVKNVNCGVRITFTAMKYNVPAGTAETGKYAYWNSSYVNSTERYCSLQAFYFWVGTNSDGLSCKCEKANGNASTTWTTVFNKDTTEAVTGWSGGDYIAFPDQVFGGGTTQTGQAWNWRLTFFTRNQSGGITLSTSNTGSAQQINRILGYGANGWVTPNNLFGIGHLYTWDTSANATFPASITANAGYLKSTLNGNTVTIGSANTGYCHFSNSANIPFWFNNNILLENGKGIGTSGGYGPSFIEMMPATNSTNNGGYIDFHYNRSTSDYTARIIEDASAQLSVYGMLRIGANTQSSVANAGIVVNDVRNATITNNSIDRAANFYFTNSGTPDTGWWSLLHVKGWSGAYSAWELAGPAHNYDQRTTPLYVRTGNASNTWGSWRKILDGSMLTSATNSSSETLVATPKAVKAAYDLANTANTAAGNAMSATTGALYFKITYSISNGNVVGEAHVYSKGNEVTSQHNDSCFVWSYCVGTGSWVSLGTGKTKTVTVSSLGFGGNLKCDFTPASTS